MRSGWWLATCGFAVSLVGCNGSQGEAPECSAPSSCVCQPLYAGGILLRVHGEFQDRSSLSVRVISVLSPPEQARGLEFGDRVAGSILAERPCAPGESAGPLTDDLMEMVEAPDLFVLYQPKGDVNFACPPLQHCTEVICEGLTDAELLACRDRCDFELDHPCKDRGVTLEYATFGWVMPWADELSFGADQTLSSADVVAVADLNSCLERFPDPACPAMR